MTSVDIKINDDAPVRLVPGSWIGRSPSATLRIDEPTISEAHAFVSLRGTSLRLLALRGRFSINRRYTQDAELIPGRDFVLGPGIVLHALAVTLPSEVLAIKHATHGCIVPPPVVSFGAAGGPPGNGASPDALAILWATEDSYKLRRTGQPDATLRVGDTFIVAGEKWAVTTVALGESAAEYTQPASSHAQPLIIVVRYDTVHISAENDVTALDGMPARIVTELALARVPMDWHILANQIWPDEKDRAHLRVLWDGALGRLRRLLRARRVRANLVRTNGGGLIELLLGPEDVVQDET